jgi:hypothetical protein
MTGIEGCSLVEERKSRRSKNVRKPLGAERSHEAQGQAGGCL